MRNEKNDQPGAADSHELGPDSWLSPAERRRLTRRTSDRAVLVALAFTGIVASFMMTLMTPLLPELPHLLDVPTADAMWAVTATLLAAAVATPIGGRLGDLYGKRRIVIVFIGFLIAGSAVAAFATTLIPLIIGRGMQGVALGVIPLGVSILRDVLHPRKLGGGIALMSSTLGVGGALGLPVAAVISQYLDWHMLFWVSGGLGIIGMILVWWLVPVSTLRSEGSFDLVGAIGLAVALSTTLLAVSKGNEWGWGSTPTLVLGIGGLVVLGFWVLFELRSTSPLIDIRVAFRRTVLLTNLASITVGFAFFTSTVSLPLLLESSPVTGVGLGQSMFIASLCLMPSGLIMWAIAGTAAKITARYGARVSLLLGATVIAIGFVLAMFLMTEVWHAIVISAIVGLGVGIGYSAMPTLIMGAVPASETAASNGLNAVMRTLGSTSASAVLGIVFALNVITVDGVTTTSAEGFRLSFAIAAGAVIIGAILTAFIPRRHVPYATQSMPVIR